MSYSLFFESQLARIQTIKLQFPTSVLGVPFSLQGLMCLVNLMEFYYTNMWGKLNDISISTWRHYNDYRQTEKLKSSPNSQYIVDLYLLFTTCISHFCVRL